VRSSVISSAFVREAAGLYWGLVRESIGAHDAVGQALPNE
jgi:hypothetical protein